MEENSKERKKKCFNVSVTLGIVGHCPIEELSEMKRVIESLSFFDLVFFKTSSGKLWIQEGNDNMDGGGR